MTRNHTRMYKHDECITFRKTAEVFGGLSNMAAGFPLRVNGIHILTSEALYQACRFPNLPEIQRLILAEYSPMTAKMRSKRFRDESRSDWNLVRVKIMRWSLRVKLAQNWHSFGSLLLSTGEKPIVEESTKDDFWGAKPQSDQTLIGTNALGRLLMELREELKADSNGGLRFVAPLIIPNFLLVGKTIEPIAAYESIPLLGSITGSVQIPVTGQPISELQQPLFEPSIDLFTPNSRASKRSLAQRNIK